MSKTWNRHNAAHTAERADVYTRVTDKILADLEQGVRPWMKPWKAGHPVGTVSRPLRANGLPYKGVNVLMLWTSAMSGGYVAPIWMTYRQAQELGGQVKKGEKGSLVVYANTLTVTEENPTTGQDEEKAIPFMKGYTVFNVEQVEGLPGHYYAPPVPPSGTLPERLDRVERFVAETQASIRHGGDSACFIPSLDRIEMPPYERFQDRESYYATLTHELTHWTGHKSRLDRDLKGRFGSSSYAAEELIAEMGAAFLCADLGITPEVRDDHAAYLDHWLKVLKADKRAIFTAAAAAQKASDYLHSCQPSQGNPSEEETTEEVTEAAA